MGVKCFSQSQACGARGGAFPSFPCSSCERLFLGSSLLPGQPSLSSLDLLYTYQAWRYKVESPPYFEHTTRYWMVWGIPRHLFTVLTSSKNTLKTCGVFNTPMVFQDSKSWNMKIRTLVIILIYPENWPFSFSFSLRSPWSRGFLSSGWASKSKSPDDWGRMLFGVKRT